MLSTDQTLPLIRQPHTPDPIVGAIDVQVVRRPDGHLALGYRLCGDIARLVVPAPALPEPADGLWKHTCFEVFVTVIGDATYREFNFSPSGQWAAYAFSG